MRRQNWLQRSKTITRPIMPDNLGHIHGTPLNLAASPNASLTDKIKAFLDTRIIQENCLTTAVYFEARSESMVGQLAVAMVILNRVKASNSHSSICGVVYKGASHLNACQFSFACDGKPDIMDDARAWKAAYAVTAIGARQRQERPADTDSRHRHQLPCRLCRSRLVQVAPSPDPAWPPYLLFADLGPPLGLALTLARVRFPFAIIRGEVR